MEITETSFDSLRLRAYGPNNDGAVYMGIDNVEIAPEPATLLLLGLGGIFLRKKRKA